MVRRITLPGLEPAMRILVVEDEEKLAEILVRGLKAEGYQVETALTAGDGLDLVEQSHYDLLLLDLQLPDYPGTALLRKLRQQRHDLPVLVLTARADLESKIENFDNGADDYLTKPFAFAELLMRVRALLRRGPAIKSSLLRVADLELDRLTHQVRRAGQKIELSPKEFSLLEYFMLNAGRALSRSMIIDRVWDQSFEGLTNIVDVYVAQLRRKIDESFEPKLIRTIRGLGYSIEGDAE